MLGSRAGVSKCGALFETLLRGPTQWYVESFEGEHGVMIEIGDVTKRGRNGWRKTSPAETSTDKAVPNKSNNYNPHQYLLYGQVVLWRRVTIWMNLLQFVKVLFL